MPPPDDKAAIRQMLESAYRAAAVAKRRTKDELRTDFSFEAALTRLVQIIGEAATRVSKDFQARHPEVPWQRIVGMRHRLVHAYDAVDYDTLWNTVVEKLPALASILERLVVEED